MILPCQLLLRRVPVDEVPFYLCFEYQRLRDVDVLAINPFEDDEPGYVLHGHLHPFFISRKQSGVIHNLVQRHREMIHEDLQDTELIQFNQVEGFPLYSSLNLD